MSKFEYVAPCHFGIEAVLKREIQDLGYEIVEVEDGKITFSGESEAIARANIFLRTAERILLKVGKFQAKTFDELFENTKAIEWERYLPKNAKFWVTKATTVKSDLKSTPDIQSIMKKAIVDRMKVAYKTESLDETGAEYPIRVTLLKDEVVVGLDTTGLGLHKRGYRKATAKAPIKETLAAALILISPWNKDRPLVDPFCGSGTIPIEAAMIGAKIAPGMNRSFIAESWTNIVPKKEWYSAIEEAYARINRDVIMNIQGYDISDDMVKAARENAQRAEVDQLIHFQQRAVKDLKHPKKYGFIITNPPYGERLSEKEYMPELYGEIGEVLKNMETWSCFIISGYEDAQKYIGKKATKNRKIYNGMMKTYFYQFMGPKPPRARE
ncbi:THUMP domain-containing class I SAM-dependent RNA methyltransferase [Anaeromicropila populeti]|uniref:Putative N6-adenine-specific DNA methylase n=1 Tax=Anaeromicropila populeti TaxID=37658 RepID=A0A1I6K0W7_9FIRM|nr:class I SAM-dependent RNA methyltransferase [Anaeromicropila populeti]SFR84879.1 putative N6-adenine-specific DNA methylase [Anaeromicropila populeti]